MPHADTPDLDQLINDGAIRLEITRGIPTWEVSPSSRHQRMVFRIQTSIKPIPESDKGCECAHLSDVYIRFPDGSLKRPDIAIFCAEPPDQDEALTLIPQAVIEVISPGYEYKDIALNPQFYLAQGVQDVVVIDPRSGIVTHYRATEVWTLSTPITVELLCGCQCNLP
jgi:Uma2 family endonuclease